MYGVFVRWYNKTELGLDIKPWLNRFFFWVHKTWLRVSIRLQYRIDVAMLLPLSKKLQRYFSERIKAHYGADYHWGDERSQNLDSHTASLGYGLLQNAVVRNQKPGSILCVGSMYGFIPFMLAKACEDNQHGHVYFVDAGYNIADVENKRNHFFGQGFWKKPGALNQFNYLLDDSKKYLSIHVMTSQSFAKRYRRLTFDYIYLDGDHSYVGAKRDIRLFWNRLRDGGYLILHDTSYDRPDSKIQIDMKRIWKEITKNPAIAQKIEFTNNYSGIGIVKKVSHTMPI